MGTSDDETNRREVLSQATRWLARREYSVHELKERLRSKGFDSDLVTETLEDLVSQGLVSDRRFAESLTRNRVERGYGPVKIAHELKTRGVEESLVDEILADDGDRWLEQLRRVWRKRFGTEPANYREWASQARKLQSRGFTAEQVRRVIPGFDS